MITIKATEAVIDHIIDCMIHNCDGCPARGACMDEEKKCEDCPDEMDCLECTRTKSCGEQIREAINFITEE